MDMDGFDEGDYDTRKLPDHVENGDPFMTFAAKTKPSWVPASQSVEMGLWNDYRIRWGTGGIWGWDQSSGVWVDMLAGGGFWVAGLTGCTASGTSIGYDGHVYATRVFNAVWNDYADFWRAEPGVKKQPGICYSFNLEGLIITNKRADKACMGICSDTYGHAVGNQHNAIPLSIGGFLLAHVNKKYAPGTLLVPNKNGILTKARFYEKRKAVAKYLYKEKKMKTKGVWVKNRHWVKII
jgi:hypothetical protein